MWKNEPEVIAVVINASNLTTSISSDVAPWVVLMKWFSNMTDFKASNQNTITEATTATDLSHSWHFNLSNTDVTNNRKTGWIQFRWTSSRALVLCLPAPWQRSPRPRRLNGAIVNVISSTCACPVVWFNVLILRSFAKCNKVKNRERCVWIALVFHFLHQSLVYFHKPSFHTRHTA